MQKIKLILQLFARDGANYSLYNGTKLEYSEISKESFVQIHGITDTPDIGGEPNSIDTTDLDNIEYETARQGLMPVQKYNFDMNLEDPAADANMNIISKLEDSKKIYLWKLTYANGIVITFKSKVKTTIKAGKSGELIKFTTHLQAETEPTRTIPNASV